MEQKQRFKLSRTTAVLAIVLFAFLLTLLMLSFSMEDASWALALKYARRPLLVLLNGLPIVLWALGWYFATGSVGAAFTLAALPTLALSYVNYYKLLLRDDPLIFEDLTLLSEATAMSARYEFRLTSWVIWTAVIVTASAALLFWLFHGANRFAAATRLGGAVLAFAGIAASLLWLYPNNALYSQTGIAGEWAPTQTYTDHGVMYPFLHSISQLESTPPDGYDAQTVAATLNAYEDETIPASKKVSIIAMQLEAFGDFSGIVDFAADPYADFHALQAESLSGTLLTNIFAGGTVDTERCFLTGAFDLCALRRPTNSFVRYFRSQGYATTGFHPWYKWFYNRENVNGYLGFDDYAFLEDRFMPDGQTLVTDDANLFATILADYQAKHADGAPVFSFSVTYQNHGPYDEQRHTDTRYVSDSYALTDDERAIADNYFAGLADTGAQLAALKERLNAESDPIVLIAFGDHKPWLGDKNSVYKALGVNLDASTEDGFRNYYATPFLMWANAAAKEALGADFVGDVGETAAYRLLPLYFKQAGLKGDAYAQAVAAVEDAPAFINCVGYEHDGRILALEDGATDAVKRLQALQFDRLHGDVSNR